MMDPFNTSVASTSSRLSSSSSVSFADDWEFSKLAAAHGIQRTGVWETAASPSPPPGTPGQKKNKKQKNRILIQKPRPEYYGQYDGLEEARPVEEVLAPVPEVAPLAAKVAKFDLYLETLPEEQKPVAMKIAENFKSNPSVFVFPSSSLISSMIPLPSCFQPADSTDPFTFDPSESKLNNLLADSAPTNSGSIAIPDWPPSSSISTTQRLQKKRSFEEVLVGLQEGDGATRCFGHIVADSLKDKPAGERVALAQEIWTMLTSPKRVKLSSD